MTSIRQPSQRTKPDSTLDPSKAVIGADEVGLGCWAGPLVVCAAVAEPGWKPPKGLKDSKQLSPRRRLELYSELYAMPFALMMADSTVIDAIGVRKALMRAFYDAVSAMLKRYPGAPVVIDGTARPPGLPDARCVPKADDIYPVVSAASVIAKVNRDRYMVEQDGYYPGYDFNKNMGYGTKKHYKGLKALGVCPLHRRSYRPVQEFLP